MKDKEQLIVSFCIPVYNNAEAALRIVNDLLVSDSDRFEVVVSDDASSDNAEQLLSQVKDSRFRYYRNEKNLGAHKNWEHSLELGKGEYLYLIMGRDKMNGENITNLINLLEEARTNNVTYLKDRGRQRKAVREFFEGIDALSAFVDYNHPTGSIFRRKEFTEIPNREYYFESADMYPESKVARDLLLKGKGAFISSGLGDEGFVLDKKKIKSTVEHDINLYDTYFAPRRRTLQFFELIDMVDPDLADKFTPEELCKYFKAKFYSLLNNVSFLWFVWCKDDEQMAHYGQKVSYIPLREMISNIFQAYRDTKAHIMQNGTYTPQKEHVMRVCVAKAIPCLAIYAKIKHYFKKMLTPLGVWAALRFIKRSVKQPMMP